MPAAKWIQIRDRAHLLARLLLLLLVPAACSAPAAPSIDAPASVLPSSPAAQIVSLSPSPTPVYALPVEISTDNSQTMDPGPTPSASPLPSVAPVTPTPAFQLCSPLDLHPLEELPEIISDPYHPPPPGKEERHHGVDFSYYRRGERLTIEEVGVQSALPGRVAMALSGSFPYGNVVIIETQADRLLPSILEQLDVAPGESLYLLYAHFGDAPLVAAGDRIEACHPLGKVGKSGNAGVAHLHLETRIGPQGQSFESMQFYMAQATLSERETYLLWRTSGIFRHFDPMRLLVK